MLGLADSIGQNKSCSSQELSGKAGVHCDRNTQKTQTPPAEVCFYPAGVLACLKHSSIAFPSQGGWRSVSLVWRKRRGAPRESLGPSGFSTARTLSDEAGHGEESMAAGVKMALNSKMAMFFKGQTH